MSYDLYRTNLEHSVFIFYFYFFFLLNKKDFIKNQAMKLFQSNKMKGDQIKLITQQNPNHTMRAEKMIYIIDQLGTFTQACVMTTYISKTKTFNNNKKTSSNIPNINI